MGDTIKSNPGNDEKFKDGVLKEGKPQYTGKVYQSLEEAAKSIKKEDVQYITD